MSILSNSIVSLRSHSLCQLSIFAHDPVGPEASLGNQWSSFSPDSPYLSKRALCDREECQIGRLAVTLPKLSVEIEFNKVNCFFKFIRFVRFISRISFSFPPPQPDPVDHLFSRSIYHLDRQFPFKNSRVSLSFPLIDIDLCLPSASTYSHSRSSKTALRSLRHSAVDCAIVEATGDVGLLNEIHNSNSPARLPDAPCSAHTADARLSCSCASFAYSLMPPLSLYLLYALLLSRSQINSLVAVQSVCDSFYSINMVKGLKR